MAVATRVEIGVPSNGKTYYGDKIISISNIVKSNEKSIRVGLRSIFGNLGLSTKQLSETIDFFIRQSQTYSNLKEYEHSVHKFMLQSGVWKKYHSKKTNRSLTRYKQVSKYLKGKSVLDLGCGAGKIGKWASDDGYDVTLVDVYKNSTIKKLKLPFFKIKDGEKLPFDDEGFDNVLNLGMLHHTNNPEHTLSEGMRILKKGGRLNLIETLYGISPKSYARVYKTDDTYFKKLSFEEQRQVCMFFDYSGNHILDAYTSNPRQFVPVPFNYTTPEGLLRLSSKVGYTLLFKEDLGIYPFSYNYHVHFVFEKN